MMEALIVAASDAAEPVSLDVAKQHCRVDIDDDDGLLETIYIPAARQTVEEYTGLTLRTCDVDALVPGSVCTSTFIPVSVQPAQTLTAVSTIDANGNETPLDIDEYGLAIAKAGMRSVIVARNGSLPTVNAYRVQYVAGFADGTYPPNLLLAVLEFVGDAYENREAQQMQYAIQENPRAVRLMDPYRITFGL
jgi:uncharacterized phiE125 gp8 family phage protein